ncbi:MAG: cell division protein FtsZ [Patescibacteria group bacterium]
MKKKKQKNEAGPTSRPGNISVKMKVVGVGGGGGNAVSRMFQDIGIRGIDFVAINTDVQDLDYCNARHKIYIGKNLTRGMGTGMNPDLGRQAAEENRSEIVEALRGSDIVFLTAGLGGGTGSGASPVIADAAREVGALTIAVVTKPFVFEGSQRSRIADEALAKLKERVDTLIVIPNDRIFNIIKKETPLLKAFEYIDDVLRSAVQGIAELIAMPGIINLDFADVRAIMKDAGPALVGIGIASGQERAIGAVTQVMNSPLLEISIDGAKGVLFGVAGNRDLKMVEINDIAKSIAAAVDPSAKIIFGAYYDRKLKRGELKVTLIATGFNGQIVRAMEPTSAPMLFTEPLRKIEPPAPPPETPAKKGMPKASDRKKESEGGDDIWEIPAFLRRKK